MKCLRKFVWVKIPRAEIPHNSKGMMLYFLRLASRAAFRKGKAKYCGHTNEVDAGCWVGGVVGLKSILEAKSRRAALEILDELQMMGYITSIVEKTRSYPKVLLGVSPRGALSLMKAAKGYAAIAGRNYVTPDDVKRAAHPVLDHRLTLENAARIKKNAAYEIIDDILGMVTVPTEAVFEER